MDFLKTDAAEAEILTGLTDRAEAAKRPGGCVPQGLLHAGPGHPHGQVRAEGGVAPSRPAVVSADVQGFLRHNENGKLCFHDWADKEKYLPYMDFLKTDAMPAPVIRMARYAPKVVSPRPVRPERFRAFTGQVNKSFPS